MAREFAQRFYASTKWKKCRASYIAIRIAVDGGLCERCKQTTGYIVHHGIELTSDNIGDDEVSLNHKHFEYLCQNCHNKVGDTERYCMFDGQGQPIFYDAVQSGDKKL